MWIGPIYILPLVQLGQGIINCIGGTERLRHTPLPVLRATPCKQCFGEVLFRSEQVHGPGC